jgi:hypothetical protein
MLCLVALPGAQAMAAENTDRRPGVRRTAEKLDNFDARKDGPARQVLAARSAAMAASPKAGVRELRQLARQCRASSTLTP